MQQAWWERPVCFVCNYWWIILVVFVLLLTTYFSHPLWLPGPAAEPTLASLNGMVANETSQPPSTEPPREIYSPTPTEAETAPALEEGFVNPYLIPVNEPLAIIGQDVTPVPVSSEWLSYRNDPAGFSLRYPPDWVPQEFPNQGGVSFYPPGSRADEPGPLISFFVQNDHPFDPSNPTQAGKTNLRPILVDGLQGIQYEDSSLAIPEQGFYVEFPLKTGTLLISATEGPQVNLTPALMEMLQTLEVKP